MVTSSQVAQARRRVESQMTDYCEIGREVPGTVLDETTGEYETTVEAVYAGPCKFKAANTAVREVDAQSQSLIEQGATLAIPVDAEGSDEVVKDLIALVTLGYDGATALRARITGLHNQTFSTARRFPVELVS